MVNSVLNKSTIPNLAPAKASQEATPGMFQDIFSSINNIDINSTKTTSESGSFQIERAPVKEKVETPKSTREQEVRERDNQEAREVTKRNERQAAARLENLPNDIAATDKAIQMSANERAMAQKEAVQTDVPTNSEKQGNAGDIANDDAAKAQTEEVATQPLAAETAKAAAAQQGETRAVNAVDSEAKRMVNVQQPNNGITEKVDGKGLQTSEEGMGKQNLAGEEKDSGSNQQKASSESAPKITNAQATPQNQLLNTLKQPSFKETVNTAMKVEAKAGDAVGNQNSQNSMKTLETKLQSAADIERPKQAAKFAQVVGHNIRNMKFDQGKNEMTVRIDPPQLGKMKINVSMDQGKITTSIVAESQSVKNALESNMNLLKGTLEQGGLKVENLTVTVNEGSKENPNLNFGDRKNNNGQAGNNRNENPAQTFEESEMEQYVKLSTYRAESKGVYFVSTTA